MFDTVWKRMFFSHFKEIFTLSGSVRCRSAFDNQLTSLPEAIGQLTMLAEL